MIIGLRNGRMVGMVDWLSSYTPDCGLRKSDPEQRGHHSMKLLCCFRFLNLLVAHQKSFHLAHAGDEVEFVCLMRLVSLWFCQVLFWDEESLEIKRLYICFHKIKVLRVC